MKKIYGFAFAAAVMALASCSNDNEPVNNPNPTPAPAGPGSYVAVNICNPANTRAEGYQVGTTQENKVVSGTFYIFKDGVMEYQQPLDANADWQGPLDMGNTVEVIGGTTLLIPDALTSDLKDEEGNMTADKVPGNLSILVVLNDATKNINIPNGTKLEDAYKIVTNASINEAAENDFLMSNSTYYTNSNTTKVVAVPISTSNLVATESEAKAHPVNVYVERTVARVDYAKADRVDGTDWLQNNTIHFQNAPETTVITPQILGVEIVYNPENSALFKEFDADQIGSWSTLANLNDEGKFRSFWATMIDGINQPDIKYSDIAGANFDNEDWNDKKTHTMYIHENTSAEKPSTVLVYAKLDLGKDNEGNDKSLAALYGQYTDKEGAINMVANTIRGLGYRIATVETVDGEEVIKEVRTVNPSDLAWSNEVYSATENDPVPAESGNRTYLKFGTTLGASEKVVKVNGTAYAPSGVDALNAELAGIAISVWEKGYCYYYTTIDHRDAGSGKTAGVVRNHLYDIKFNGMSGLGTPVFDPDKVVIPVKPKYDEGDNVYLAASINILQWRVASQNTILGQD